MILFNGMDTYFKHNPPDCALVSQNNNILVHKEVLLQTEFMLEMLESVDTDSEIKIICELVSKEELEIIVNFLYSGEISCVDQNLGNQVSRTLTELFGFPLLQESMSERI